MRRFGRPDPAGETKQPDRSAAGRPSAAQVLKQLDTDGDGAISTGEIPASRRERLTGADADSDGLGDACDPDSDYNPVPLYDATTNWAHPVVRVHTDPVLDIMAIDNLPSLLPLESSEDYAAQLLPTLLALENIDTGAWRGALDEFRKY